MEVRQVDGEVDAVAGAYVRLRRKAPDEGRGAVQVEPRDSLVRVDGRTLPHEVAVDRSRLHLDVGEDLRPE